MFDFLFKARREKQKGNFLFRGFARRKRRQQQGVLQGVTSAREASQLRRARLILSLKWGGAGVVAVACFFGLRSVSQRLFWSGTQFVVREPVVTGLKDLSRTEVLRQAGLDEPRSIFSIDLDAVRRKLEEWPRIRSVTVERTLPETLTLKIEEREPLAWLACENERLTLKPCNTKEGFLVDRDGIPFKCDTLREALRRLPIINIPSLSYVKSGSPVETPLVRRSLDLLASSRTALLGYNVDIVEIIAANEWSMLARLSDDSSATFGLENLDRQLLRLRSVREHLRLTGRLAETVNLIPEHNVPVTYYTGPAANPALTDKARMGTTLPLGPSPAVPASLNTTPNRQPSSSSATNRRRPAATPPAPAPAPAPAKSLPPQNPGSSRDRQVDEILGGGR